MKMAAKTTETVKESGSGPGAQLEGVMAFNNTNVELFTQACQAYAAGVARLNGELLSFVNARLNQDVDLGRALCKCDKWSEALSLQQDWAQRASQEYLSEGSKLMELASKVTQEDWAPLYGRVNQVLAELNEKKD
jgi:hypothetical protein